MCQTRWTAVVCVDINVYDDDCASACMCIISYN